MLAFVSGIDDPLASQLRARCAPGKRAGNGAGEPRHVLYRPMGGARPALLLDQRRQPFQIGAAQLLHRVDHEAVVGQVMLVPESAQRGMLELRRLLGPRGAPVSFHGLDLRDDFHRITRDNRCARANVELEQEQRAAARVRFRTQAAHREKPAQVFTGDGFFDDFQI